MKERIVKELAQAAREPAADLVELCRMPAEKIRENAALCLQNLLQQYSWFSVGTIDSFFQRIIQEFTLELQLPVGMQIRLDTERVLEEAVEMLFSRADEHKQLRNWLLRFMERNIEEGGNWNLRNDMLSFGKEVFKERFLLMEPLLKEHTRDLDRMETYSRKVFAALQARRKEIIRLAGEALLLCRNRGLQIDDFSGKSTSVYAFFEKVAFGEVENIPQGMYTARDDFDKWYKGKTPPPALEQAWQEGLRRLLDGIIKGMQDLKGLKMASKHLYTLGLSHELMRNIHALTSEENSLLISDAGQLIRLLIGEDQTPFIYEKVGTQYQHFLIDEFQDTSRIQWENFLPLIKNSMAAGNKNMLVGDVKQSIYRWRNSDWRILGSEVEKTFHAGELEKRILDKNFRSTDEIVAFNNRLFQILPAVMDEQREAYTQGISGEDTLSFSSLYSDARQVSQDVPGGRVKIIREAGEDFKHTALLRAVQEIRELLDEGCPAADMGILVRKKEEGRQMAEALIKEGLPVMSTESLYVHQAEAVRLLLTVLKLLVKPGSVLWQTELLEYYSLLKTDAPLLYDKQEYYSPGNSKAVFDKTFGRLFAGLQGRIRSAGLFTLLYEIIRWFDLDHIYGQQPYINAFLDAALEYQQLENGDISGFLNWWDKESEKRAIAQPEGSGAIQIMTIHKAKGLKFRWVIMPFLDWKISSSLEEILWVPQTKEPLNEFQVLPLSMSSAMLETEYAPAWADEIHARFLDSLNMVYVAFTRAVEGIVGIIPDKTAKNTFGLAMQTALDSMEMEEDDQGVLHFGTKTEISKQQETKIDDSVIRNLQAVRNSPFYLIRTKTDALKEENGKQMQSLLRGRLLHEIFSELHTVEDLPLLLKKMQVNGLVSAAETGEIENLFRKRIERKPVADWFDGSGEVIAERSILLPGGGSKRPDRIIRRGNEAEVVDFKFGQKEQAAYEKQLSEYMQILKEMGFAVVKGYIWYFMLDKVVEVKGKEQAD